MGPCGLLSLKYCLFGPFQLLYPHPITSFQLQVLTSPTPSALCKRQHPLSTSTETLWGDCREKGFYNVGLSGPSVIPQASLQRLLDSFLPTPAPEGLVPVPEFPFPLEVVRGLPIPLYPMDLGKWSLPAQSLQTSSGLSWTQVLCPSGPGLQYYSTRSALFQGLFSSGSWHSTKPPVRRGQLLALLSASLL